MIVGSARHCIWSREWMKYMQMYNCICRQFFVSFRQTFKLCLNCAPFRVVSKIKNFKEFLHFDRFKNKILRSRVDRDIKFLRVFVWSVRFPTRETHDYHDYRGILRPCNIAAFYAYTRSYFGNYNGEILFDFDDGHYFLIRLIHSLYGYVTGREIFPESIHLILKKENDIVCTQRF